jgi:hypothetical protein
VGLTVRAVNNLPVGAQLIRNLRGIRTAQTAWPGSPGRCSRSDPAAYMAAATPVPIVTGLQPAPVLRARRLGSGQELKDPASTTRPGGGGEFVAAGNFRLHRRSRADG